MSAAATRDVIDGKDAIRVAFEQFDELFGRVDPRNVLLEALRFEEGKLGESPRWHVTIGFEAGRNRERPGNRLVGTTATMEPVREFRTFILTPSGDLIGMSNE